jgi:hypothetical protein
MRTSPSRGDLARDEEGRLGVIVDEYGGLYVGCTYPVGARWASREPTSLGSFTLWVKTGPHQERSIS